MAAHVYLSQLASRRRDGDGRLVFPPEAIMRHRGEVAPGDDPVSFTAKMAASGHLVRVVSTFKGEAVTLAQLEG